MNRFKKELMRKGIKLEHEYPCLPFPLPDSGVSLEATVVRSETASVVVVTNVMRYCLEMARDGSITEAWWD